ncbi:MAG: ribonuclease E/G, partial [Nitrosomonas sp.]
RNQREVEARLHEALRQDRARIQVGKISRFGLLELSRQRLRPSLGESNYIPCPRCNGTGFIRGTDSSALHVLRIIQEEAMKENTSALHVQLPVDVATYLLNEKRGEIYDIEVRQRISIVLIPNIHIETPNYTITRIRHDDIKSNETVSSYKLVEKKTEENSQISLDQKNRPVRLQAAVQGIKLAQPAPIREENSSRDTSLLDKFFSWFKPANTEEIKPNPEEKRQTDIDRTKAPQDRGRSRSRRGRNNRNERTKDISANQVRQSDSSDLTSVASEQEVTVTEQPSQRVAVAERKSNKKKFLQPPDPDSVTSTLSEDLSIIEPENLENSNIKPDDHRRTRRHRSNKNRNQSAPKSSIDDQNLAAEESPDIQIDSKNSSADLQPNVEKIIPIKEKSTVAASKHSVKKTTVETPMATQSIPTTTDGKQAPLEADTKSPKPITVKELPDFTKSGLVMIETPPEKVELVTEEIIVPKRPRKRIKEAIDTQAEPLMQVETRE